MTHYLVTTALESTWKFDRPVLFLGEWCRRHGRKTIWTSLDAIVAPPYGLSALDKRRQVLEIQQITENLLGDLGETLNQIHQRRHSNRYWQIVLGHWLQRFVATAYNRYHTLAQALSSFDVSGTTVLRAPSYSLTTRDSLEYIWATNDDFWNHVFLSRVLDYLAPPGCVMNEAEISGPSAYIDDRAPPARGSLLRTALRHVTQAVLPQLARSTDAVIVNSYLPVKEEIRLQLALGQVPQRWTTPSPVYPQPTRGDDRLPGWPQGIEHDFSGFVRRLLPEVLPSCFLEGYETVECAANHLGWPSRPRFIFTSNNFDTDEVFKVWAAAKAEKGIPYFTGQHGNNYGTHFFYGNHTWPERSATDGFLTWGWDDGQINTVPAFIFKAPPPQKAQKVNSSGGMLLIESCATHRIMPWDVDSEHLEYLDQQFRFVDALTASIRDQLVVRLHAGGGRMQYSEPERWSEHCPEMAVDHGRRPLQELLASTRLVVHSYDSTGILEMLVRNTPCICFWPGGLDHLEESAKPYYQKLRACGILQDGPEEAAKMIERVWEDVPAWWLSMEVQQAREAFCGRYARLEQHPGRAAKRIIADRVRSMRSAQHG